MLEQKIFHQMETVRGLTEKSINKIPEEIANIVPQGFNNNIRWNFGHIAYIQEKLVYGVLGEQMSLPQEYEKLFSAGTKPADWEQTPPTLEEISVVLTEQKSRVKKSLQGNFDKELPKPFTNKAGITFPTLGDTFLFSFYHEALHMEAIKRIYLECK
ncbi:DinB family protein [Psychrobacillus sp. FJAT-51614]|uniref:DinB family protein n=1 Tax=Psychrobacillus mangrovi TaxID=3117745 RepID=A0ABU8EZV5_9BACI